MKNKRAKNKPFHRKLWVFLLFLTVVVLLFYHFHGKEKVKPETFSRRQVTSGTENVKKVKLFFASQDGENLITETREIIGESDDVSEKARKTMIELINGPADKGIRTLPASTILRELFIDENGIAYVNLSKEAVVNHPKGVWSEVLTVYSIVNTLIFNFPEIKSVKILVEGAEKEELAGHVSIEKPLREYIAIVKFD
jgi:hypothetical protein